MAMFLNNMDTEELISKLTSSQKDDIYRALWKEHVIEDVEARLSEQEIEELETLTEEEYDLFVNAVATRYVYEGDYDCNLCYWDNIDNLIDDELQYMKNNEIDK